MVEAKSEDRVTDAASGRAHSSASEDSAEPCECIATAMTFEMSPATAWERLMFYEQIAEQPPLLLRWLLPHPLRVEGPKARVGDVAKCVYDRGYLLKRVTVVDPPREYAFEVVEQALAVGGGIRLAGGSYRMTAVPGGGTGVELITRYCGGRRPRWLARPIEAAVCHMFHRYVLRAIRGARAPESARAVLEPAE